MFGLQFLILFFFSPILLFQIVIKKKLLFRGAVTALVRIAARDYQSEEKAWVDQHKQMHVQKQLKQKVMFQPVEAATASASTPRVAISAPVSPVAKVPPPLPPPRASPAPPLPPPPTVAPPAWDAKHDGQLRAAAVGLEALTLTIVVPFEGYVATCQALCNTLFSNSSRSATPTAASMGTASAAAAAGVGVGKGSFSFDSGARRLTPVPPAKLQLVEGERENWWKSPLAFGRTGPSGGCGFLLHCQVPTPRNLANRRPNSGSNNSYNSGSGEGNSSSNLHNAATAATARSNSSAAGNASLGNKEVGPWEPGALCPLVIAVHTAASARAWAVATASWKDFRAANSPAQRAAAAARAHAAVDTVPVPPGARDELPVSPPPLLLHHQSSSFSPRRFGLRRNGSLQRSSSSSSLQRSSSRGSRFSSFSNPGSTTSGTAAAPSSKSKIGVRNERSVSKTTSAMAASVSLLLAAGCAHRGSGLIISGLLLGAAYGAILRLIEMPWLSESWSAVVQTAGRCMDKSVRDLSRRCSRGFKSDTTVFALLQQFRPAGVRYRRSISRLRSRSTGSSGVRNGWALLRELHRRGLLQPSDGPQILREIAKHRAARAAEVVRAEAAAEAAYDPFVDRVEELLLHGERPTTLTEIRDRAQKAYFRHRRLSSLQVQEAPEVAPSNVEGNGDNNNEELDDDDADAFVPRNVPSAVLLPFLVACVIIALSSVM